MLKLLTNDNSSEIDLVSLSLDDIARLGTKKLLTQALALEVNEYIERNSAFRHDEGLRQVVRNGHGKERKITTGSDHCGQSARGRGSREHRLQPLSPLPLHPAIRAQIGSREGKFFSRELARGFLTGKEGRKKSQIVFRGLQDASFYHHAV